MKHAQKLFALRFDDHQGEKRGESPVFGNPLLLVLAVFFEHPAQLLTGCFLYGGRNRFGLLDGLRFLALATEPFSNPSFFAKTERGRKDYD